MRPENFLNPLHTTVFTPTIMSECGRKKQSHKIRGVSIHATSDTTPSWHAHHFPIRTVNKTVVLISLTALV